MRTLLLSAGTGSPGNGSYRFPGLSLRPNLLAFVAMTTLVLSGCDLETAPLAPIDQVQAGEALLSSSGVNPVLRMYKDENLWLPRDERALMAMGKDRGSDWFLHPTADLLSPMPSATDVVFISAQYANSVSFTNEGSPAAQANLAEFLGRNGVLVVELADTDRYTGYVAPGTNGLPAQYRNPFPCTNVTLAASALGPDGVRGTDDDHPFLYGRDGVRGTSDDVNDSNIDGESGCYVAHGTLVDWIALPSDATILVTATFGGVERPIMAEYCHAGGRVVVHTFTSGHQTHKPAGSGASNFLLALMSYVLSDNALCSPRAVTPPANQPPVISPLDGFAGTEGAPIEFTASAVDAEGGDLTYSWNFGDGSPAVLGASVSRSYVDDGEYEVTLTVTDAEGLSTTSKTSASVANVAPEVDAGQPASIYSGDTFSLQAAFSDAGVIDQLWSYAIDWAGESESGALSEQGAISRSRQFLRAGKYTVEVLVTDKDGAAGRSEVMIDVGYLPVPIDIVPGNSANRINLMGSGQGFVIVAILSTPDIDAATVDLASVLLGTVPVAKKPNGTYHSRVEDVDGDGLADMWLAFDRDQLKASGDLTPLTSSLTLHADLADGRQLEGSDRVRATVAR